jgi:hypothetical protein
MYMRGIFGVVSELRIVTWLASDLLVYFKMLPLPNIITLPS